MSIKKIFEFSDYKGYLAHLELHRSHFSRGFRSRLAEEIGCNNAFVSQVLNTHVNFSLEQAVRICRHIGGQDLERHFPSEPGVAGLIDLTHPAFAEQFQDFVMPELIAGVDGHDWV